MTTSPNEDKSSVVPFLNKTPSQQKLGKEMGEVSGNDEYESWMKSRLLQRPEDQLDLTEAELSEEVPKLLTTENTNIVKNLVIYSFKDGGFVSAPSMGNTVTLFQFEGSSLHVDSPEAKAQMANMGEEEVEDESEKVEEKLPTLEQDIQEVDKEVDPDGEGVDGEAADEEVLDDEPGASQAGPKKKLINQFNFCERAALTFNNPYRTVETQTIPPPRSTFGGNVLQWVIYDSYAEDYAQQQKEREKDTKKPPPKKDESKKKEDKTKASEQLNKKYLQSWQILERMVNQNIYDEIAQDYRYWEDPSDEFREEEGTLLPLWKFSYEKTKKLSVTDVCFNTLYYDLFAVCFGSMDFVKQSAEGSVCLFTMKNPSFPDYRIWTESGVMCCDIHVKYPYLLAIGMYDGNVAVYNLQANMREPMYMSQGVNGKHLECVSEIKWGPDMTDGELNFYSASTDGRVFNWVLMQNKLAITPIMTLYLDRDLGGCPDGTDIKLKGCATCMVFHPTNSEIFLVGTEEGLIFKCSTAYSSKYLMTYQAHYLPIYRIDFNKYNSNIFASCSGDWRIKVWEDMRGEPLFIFDLAASVGDVKWAPYSSTVFAAVTTEGKVFVFDLNVNKYKPICIQAVVSRKRNKLTRLAFNQKLPFIIVGDDKGTTISLKLSPNLRLKVKPPKKQQWMDQATLEAQKLEKLLSLVRELPEGEKIKDTATTVASGRN
ncbi:dynein intermediate chain 2, ciliary isoform X1 [Phlebotomus papatasi]|uniref:dynein intermediate chain 2, ciliary isoform X1 n=1 Tax=Phlebotomus papatasi TaxID=29031 RepID=UPI002483E416|nr:dynein intermediate chain 2, ciliary isoform X1 [Phlebotomus papatasi]